MRGSEAGDGFETTRRGILGMISVAALPMFLGSSGVAVAQQTGSDIDSVCVWADTEANLPEPDGPFFEGRDNYAFLFLAIDSGAIYYRENGDGDWQLQHSTTDELRLRDPDTSEERGLIVDSGDLYMVTYQ